MKRIERGKKRREKKKKREEREGACFALLNYLSILVKTKLSVNI